MGRTLSTDKRGEFVRDRTELVDIPETEFNPSTDINDTSRLYFRVLSPITESFDGSMDRTPPFDRPNPDPLMLGMTEKQRTKLVRNDDREDF